MVDWNRKQLGELCKKRREELGFKQHTLADERISATTISNLENGTKRLSDELLAYYLQEKLEWSMEDLPKLLQEKAEKEKQERFTIGLRLRTVENDLDCVSIQEGLRMIRQMEQELKGKRPYFAVLEYLRGKCYYHSDKLEKAVAHFQQAIQIFDEHPSIHYTNIKAFCLYQLSRSFHVMNKLDLALSCAQDGLSSFLPEGDRRYIQYSLHISKVIYYEKLERNSEAMEIIEWLEEHFEELDTEIKLNVYQLKATLYNKDKRYKKAIQCAETGIDIARREKKFDRCFELWTTAGTIYKNMGQYDAAELSFQTASKFEDKVKKKQLVAQNGKELGQLYLLQGNIVLAVEKLQNALQLSKKSKDSLRYCEVLQALGECYLQQKHHKEAIQYLKQAQKVAEEHSFYPQERDIVILLAKCYEKSNMIKYNHYSSRLFHISLKLKEEVSESMRLHETKRWLAGDPPDV
ncbi:tetratricopeptide repeat protein [Shimazuella sp. AN120528]|uniref:helix-turn-helix domain-containing protein n=1 Tax=Shimazuella soli TaxID=1892854 RepID=UPI001F10DFD9|nr:tetratricopeptide repeat protein [Shimazuella soli]MCH5583671.1 tetratricopeptide repeat protein [Shimazuella soli]